MSKFYIETYGCQMNVADSELVVGIMREKGFEHTEDFRDSDIILINTCSIRENAEQRVRGRLDLFKSLKRHKKGLLIGVIGCMAERLKERLVEEDKMVDLVVGPDAYRSLPELIKLAESGQKAVNVLLSREETYADLSPVRLDGNNVSAFISIMRGCDNMCAYCVVPFTRGRERSRNPETILREVQQVLAAGYKEVTLLGQNVDKYSWNNNEVNFAQLLERVALSDSRLRVRFSTSYPKDITDHVLQVMSSYPNICKNIHFPAQSGSNRILETMRRGYTREEYLERIAAIRRFVPDCGISTDIITGFCGETDEDHQQTIELMKEVKFDFAYMFIYSERPNTYAQRQYKDDVPVEVKSQRLTQIIDLQNHHSLESNLNDLNRTFEILVEGVSKKSDNHLFGRNSQNKVVVFPRQNYNIGDYVNVILTDCTSATLKGNPV